MDDNLATLPPQEKQYRSEYKRIGTGRSRGELRIEILNAVRLSLRLGSYETLSMEQVAARAAISRRTLYNLFTDKDELYRTSCEQLLKSVADKVTDEIPEKMSPVDGMRFFVAACMEVYDNESARDLVSSVVRDGTRQRWLAEGYHREVHDRLVRSSENFLLKKSRLSPLALGAPRFVGEQVVCVVKSLTVGNHVFGTASRPELSTKERLEVLAVAYSAVLTGKSL